MSAAIYGEDDRIEHFESSSRYLEYARSVAVIAPEDNITRQEDGYSWQVGRLQRLSETRIDGKQIHRSERFADQYAAGLGTAFLVAENVIVTAGHCVVDDKGDVDVGKRVIVFDFSINPTTQEIDTLVRSDNVYRCVELIAMVFNKEDKSKRDFAIIRLDRAVTGRQPLKVRREGIVAPDARLITIGHPLGLPLKIAFNAQVRNNHPEQYFFADLDAFSGNSGSPVLDADTGLVEGILVRGPADPWDEEPISGNLKLARLSVSEAATRGTQVQRINLIPEIAGGLADALSIFGLLEEGKRIEALSLITSGIEIDVRDSKGKSLLSHAMIHRDLELGKLLLEKGIPMFGRDKTGATALHDAAANGFNDGVNLLLHNNHPINVIRTDGVTPLYLAIYNGHESTADLLVTNGASLKINPKEGHLLDAASHSLMENYVRRIPDVLQGKPVEHHPYVIRNLGMKLVWIEPGECKMGSERSESGRDDDEEYTYSGKPGEGLYLYYNVGLNGFWLGRHEVTQGEWQSIMGTSVRQQMKKIPSKTLPISGVGANHPMYYVNWNEAMEFCRRLNARERSAGRLPSAYAYALPTEAQWEYACRAGTRGAYGGNLDAMGWYASNSGFTTHPVGQKQANAWGLFDMHGNVEEWCSDWYDRYRRTHAFNPGGPSSGSERVIRGGNWGGTAQKLRSADRFRFEPSIRGDGLGFRLALSPVR